jgi:hypothetical protein
VLTNRSPIESGSHKRLQFNVYSVTPKCPFALNFPPNPPKKKGNCPTFLYGISFICVKLCLLLVMIFSDTRLPLPESFNVTVADGHQMLGFADCLYVPSLTLSVPVIHARSRWSFRLLPPDGRIFRCKPGRAAWPVLRPKKSLRWQETQARSSKCHQWRWHVAAVTTQAFMLCCAAFFCGCRHWHNQGAARVG